MLTKVTISWNIVIFLSFLSCTEIQAQKNKNILTNRNQNDPIDPEDVRFNKFFFNGLFNPPGFKPLIQKDYPISGFTNTTLRLSDAYSVVTLDDYEVIYNVPRLIETVGGLPSNPDSNRNSDFWDMFREVIRVQQIRRRNPNDNTLFPKPMLWRNSNLNDIAEFVHDEFPGSLQSDLLEDILEERYGEVRLDLDVIPYRCDAMFLRKDFLLAFLNGWAMSIVGPHNFAAKWYAGRARPEEVAWLIRKGKLRNVPNDIVRDIQFMNLRSAADFTAYEEGCPHHPSWPAMHAASASTSFWLSIVLDLNDEQLCEARLMDYGISYARTIAGVHYPDDNIAGLNLAQEVLARALPQLLRDKYNANPFNVARKIRQNRFDWRNFDPKNPCPNIRR